MKATRLKNLSNKNDDLFVAPPKNLTFKSKKEQTAIEDLEQLRSMLRGRQLNKQKPHSKQNEDSKQVELLSQFLKPNRSARSALLPAFAFRNSQPLLQKPALSMLSIGLMKILPSNLNNIGSFVKQILSSGKTMRASIELQISQTRDTNKSFESHQKQKYQLLQSEIYATKKRMKTLREELAEAESAFQQVSEDHAKEIAGISNEETQLKRFYPKSDQPEFLQQKNQIRMKRLRKVQQYLKIKQKHESGVDKLNQDIELGQEECRSLKRNIQQVKKDLIKFYCEVLKQGMDYRENGLRWILQNLWAMNQAVPVSSFPSFLDGDSCVFLLAMAKKEIEVQEFKMRLDKLKDQMGISRSRSSNRARASDLFRKVRNRLQDLAKSSVAILGETRETEKGSQPHHEVCWVKQNIERLQTSMNEAQKTEIKRVAEEYKRGSDGKVELEHVFHCLVGDRSVEFKKFITAKKV